MSAVTRNSEREPLLESHSESFHEEADAVKITARKLSAFVYSAMCLAEKVYVEYGTATISVVDKTATVEFCVTKEPSDAMSCLLALPGYFPVPKTAEGFSTIGTVHSNVMNVHEIARVKRVTVNARLVTPPGVSPILGGVSLLCRTAFPNTESSVVNLYYDSQAWRADGLFVKSSDGVVNIVAAPLENKID